MNGEESDPVAGQGGGAETAASVDDYNRAARKYNADVKKAVNDYNREVRTYNTRARAHNRRVESNRRRLRHELQRLNSRPMTSSAYTAARSSSASFVVIGHTS